MLLGGVERALLRHVRTPGFQGAVRWLSLGLVDHVLLRTAMLDHWLREALAHTAIRQIVLLGAGFDGRAWRMEDLSECSVYEVDHPATARRKRARASRLPLRARAVRFVEVDFERDPLADRLLAAGLDPCLPAFWIWEGVTPYLPLNAVARTLEQVRRCTSSGSLLALSYARPSLMPRSLAPLDPVVRRLFGWMGEPLRGLVEPHRLHTLLSHQGFRVLEDCGERDWSRRLEHPSRPFPLARAERLLLAAREEDGASR